MPNFLKQVLVNTGDHITILFFNSVFIYNSASNGNEYQEYFLGVKAAGA